MRIYLIFLLYLPCCLFLAALLAPAVSEVLLQAGWEARPDRIIYRLAMLLAALGLPLLLPRLGLWGLAAAGVGPDRARNRRLLLLGLLAGIGILAALVAALLLLDARFAGPAHKFEPLYIARKIAAGLALGLLVGVIEEFFFRGILHTGMRRSLGFRSSAVLIAGLYAAMHFIRPEMAPAGSFDIASALAMVAGGLANLADPGSYIDSLLALFLAGLLLSMVRERERNLAWCIGIHAGWVAVIKVTRSLTEADAPPAQSFWIGAYDQITGWLAVLWLALLCAAYWWWRWRPARVTQRP